MLLASHRSYLPHLDGLRAVALIGVLAFHADLPLPRGYLGVDVFLVLSGFLITRSLLAPTFTFSAFYTRRFWRLYPSSLTIIFIATILSFVTSPETASEICSSALAALSLSSNIFWAGRSNYFSSSAQFRPLLHIWSLALEEQFYLIWPAGVVASLSLARRYSAPLLVPTIFVAVAAASFGVFLSSADENSLFYMLPTRGWEFALGAVLCAADLRVRGQTALSAASLALLLVVFADEEVLSSGQATLSAVVASAALIATPDGLVGKRVLSFPLLRVIGRYSYAAYLTHWPLWVFSNIVGYRYAAIQLWGSLETSLYVPLQFLATAVTAYALHNFVESPLRFRERLPPIRVAAVVAATALTAAIALSGVTSGGWPSRFSKTHQTSAGERAKLRAVCEDIATVPDASAATFNGITASHGCLVGGSSGEHLRRARAMPDDGAAVGNASATTKEARWGAKMPFRAVVVGNSFARHLSGALAAAFDDGPPFLLSFRDGCRLVVRRSVQILPPGGRMLTTGNRCRYHNERWWTLFMALPKGSTVVLAQDQVARKEGDRETLRAHVRELTSDMLALGLKLAIVIPVPGGRVSYICNELRVAEWAGLRLMAGLMACPVEVTGRPGYPAAAAEIRALARASAHDALEVIDVYPYICSKPASGICSRMATVDGRSERLYAPDLLHLSFFGSRAVGPAFQAFFKDRG